MHNEGTTNDLTGEYMITKGMKVKFKAEYMDEGDENVQFVAVSDEEKGRIDVQPLGFENWAIQPTQTVAVDMIELSD